MQILLACAKLMDCDAAYPEDITHSTPHFQRQADNIALDMNRYDIDELMHMLNINREIAVEVHRRYENFFSTRSRIPAMYAYDGIVFKKIDPASLSIPDITYADDHINICSFVYGLLRPLDDIAPYRMEGSVELQSTDFQSLFDFWKPLLTDYLIKKVTDDDGILVNLASNEMQNLFDWKRIKSELTVISPSFKVDKGGKLRNVTVYAKMCRGAMARHIITKRIRSLEELKTFGFEGFIYADSPTSAPTFILRT